MDRAAAVSTGPMDMPIMHDSDRYDFVKDIGSGNFGVARLMRDKVTKELVAVKYIERGDKARFFFQQLISGVSYCHAMQICHRDLKLENTLLDGSPAPRLKICDFGYSKSSVLHSQPKSTVGTPAYIAPEVLLRQEYDGKIADVWSCGVTLYVMLVGAYPFEDPDEPRDYRKTIQRILSRISIPEIKNHAWFLKNLPADLIEESNTGSQFQEPEQPMQSLDTIMQIISEATIPAVRNRCLDDFMTDNLDLDDDMDDFDSESEIDIDSSGEIVYAL
ncbi:hypothetical protein Bca101_042389 [Brassica carinata]